MHALLKAAGVSAGDEVIIQAFTCLAVPVAITALGAVPVYADIDLNTLNVDLSSLRRAVTPRTRAVVLQHTFGNPVDVSAVRALSALAGVPIFEDCCHTHGSTLRGDRVGTLADGAFYSYEWGKPVILGIGGVARTGNPSIASQMAADYADLSDPGASVIARIAVQRVFFDALLWPSTFWMVRDTFRALSRTGVAIGTFPEAKGGEVDPDFRLRMPESLAHQLRSLTAHKGLEDPQRIELSGYFAAEMHRLGIGSVDVTPGANAVFLRYPIFVQDKSAVLAAARKANVEIGDWFMSAVHPLQGDALQRVSYRPGTCPAAERAAETVVTLPIHRRVSPSAAARIVAFVGDVQRRGLVDGC